MTLTVCRHPDVGVLVDVLANDLSCRWPADPFEPLPIVVGSRGMQQWLRQALTTRLGSLSSVEFPFPGPALLGATRWLMSGDSLEPRARFWSPEAARAPAAAAFTGPGLRARLLPLVREELGSKAFEAVARYLRADSRAVAPDRPVGARELDLAGQIASALERLMYDRPADALLELSGVSTLKGDAAFLGVLLRRLHEGQADLTSPLREFERLDKLQPRRPQAQLDRTLRVFGLSTLRPGDKLRLERLSRHFEVALFMLSASRAWFQDIKTPRESSRAVMRARTAAERDALAEAAFARNPILAANGRPSRDLQAWLETQSYEELDEEAADRPLAEPDSVLRHLQGWLDRADDRPVEPASAVAGVEPPTSTLAWADVISGLPSIELHATHGPLRQCEALRDALLRRFALDPTLEPRHILVLTPDLGAFAPLIAAVFGRNEKGFAPTIPVHIADLGLRATNPVAETLLSALALGEERVTATRLAELLDLQPVRTRFRLDEEDVMDLRSLIEASALRWGWDSADRLEHDQPELDTNTLRFGLERMVLGILMPDEGGLAVVRGAPQDRIGPLGPAVPLELQSQARFTRVGRLLLICDALDQTRRAAKVPATAAIWRERLTSVLDTLTDVPEKLAWQRVEVTETLAELLPDGPLENGPSVNGPLEYGLDAVVRLLSGAFELPQRGSKPAGGAVTVCALEPMRSVPFRVVAMLGLDDGLFPRVPTGPAWDPMVNEKRTGEYDRRDIDRHLFLEAILSARDALLVFYTGFEPKQGKVIPASVAVIELQEILRAAGGQAISELLVHPLQPFSPRAFSEPRLLPFDGTIQAAARARLVGASAVELRSGPLDVLAKPLSPPLLPTLSLSVEALASALARPQRAFLSGRMGLNLRRVSTRLPDREPIEFDEYATLNLAGRIDRELAVEGAPPPSLEAIEARLRAEGGLAHRSEGSRMLEDALADVQRVRERASKMGPSLGARTFSAQLANGFVMSGSCADVRQAENGQLILVRRNFSKSIDPRTELEFALLVTVACAHLGPELSRGALVSADECTPLTLFWPPRDPCEVLEHYLGLHSRAHCEALLLFRTLSRQLAVPRTPKQVEAAPRPPSPAERVYKAGGKWDDMRGHGDRHDVWTDALFGEFSIDDLGQPEVASELVKLAEYTWNPVLEMRGKQAAAEDDDGGET